MIRIIEKSTLEFAENLAKLEKTLFSTAWDRDTINDKINRGEFLYWVYEQDDKIVGYLAIQKTLNDLHILGIGVLKDYRNQSIARNLTDVHFRGEYWKTPKKYHDLTKTSVYSVPEFPDYPFLDPHWIVRVDGSCEIGPNAVPVFSPYGYDAAENIKEFIPKVLEMINSGARKIIFDKDFQELAFSEIQSSMSKSVMVERVKKFLPNINPKEITEKGTAGIRSSVIDENGKFVPDVILLEENSSFHILNYNSPGATGALPFSVHVINQLHQKGLFENDDINLQCGPWKFNEIVEKLEK